MAEVRRKCDRCHHVFHRDQCPRKGPSRCTSLLNPDTGQPNGIACGGTRWPCPCPWGECHHCAAPIAGASPFPLYSGADEIDIDRGSAGDPGGELAVQLLADGTLAVRRLAPGEETRPGEWRGREHTCPQEETARA